MGAGSQPNGDHHLNHSRARLWPRSPVTPRERRTIQEDGGAPGAIPVCGLIIYGGLEVIAGLMIALNFGARFFAMLMVINIAVSTVLFSDFWNQAAPENAAVVVDALKNLSIIGALFMIMGYGRATRSAETAYGDV